MNYVTCIHYVNVLLNNNLTLICCTFLIHSNANFLNNERFPAAAYGLLYVSQTSDQTKIILKLIYTVLQHISKGY